MCVSTSSCMTKCDARPACCVLLWPCNTAVNSRSCLHYQWGTTQPVPGLAGDILDLSIHCIRETKAERTSVPESDSSHSSILPVPEQGEGLLQCLGAASLE